MISACNLRETWIIKTVRIKADQKLIKNKCFEKRLIKEKKGSTVKSLYIFEHVRLVEAFILVHMRSEIFFSITWNGFRYAPDKKGIKHLHDPFLMRIFWLLFWMFQQVYKILVENIALGTEVKDYERWEFYEKKQPET